MRDDPPRITMRLPAVFIGYGQFGREVLARLNEAVVAHAPRALWDGLGPAWRFLSVQCNGAARPDPSPGLELLDLDPEGAAGEESRLIFDRISLHVHEVMADAQAPGGLRFAKAPNTVCLMHVADLCDARWGPRLGDLMAGAHTAIQGWDKPPLLLSDAVANLANADRRLEAAARANLTRLVERLEGVPAPNPPLVYLISSLIEDGSTLPAQPWVAADLAVSYLEALTLARLFDPGPAGDAQNQELSLRFFRGKRPAGWKAGQSDPRIFPCLAAFGVRLVELPTAPLRKLCVNATFGALAGRLIEPWTEETPAALTTPDNPAAEPPLRGAGVRWQAIGLSAFDVQARMHEKVDAALGQWAAEGERLLALLPQKVLPELWQRARALEIGEAHKVREGTFGPEGICASLGAKPNAISALDAFLRDTVKAQEEVCRGGLKVTAWEELGRFDLRRAVAGQAQQAHEEISKMPPLLARGFYLLALLLLALAATAPLARQTGSWRPGLVLGVLLVLVCGLLIVYEVLQVRARIRRLEAGLVNAREEAFVRPLAEQLTRMQKQARQHWRARLAGVLAVQAKSALSRVAAHRVILQERSRRARAEEDAAGARRPEADRDEISLTRTSLIERADLYREALARRLPDDQAFTVLQEEVGWQGWLWDYDLLAPWQAVERALALAVAEKWPDQALVTDLKLPADLVGRLIAEGRPRQSARFRAPDVGDAPRPDSLGYWIACQQGDIPPDVQDRLQLQSVRSLSLVRTDHASAVYLWTATRNLTLDTLDLRGE